MLLLLRNERPHNFFNFFQVFFFYLCFGSLIYFSLEFFIFSLVVFTCLLIVLIIFLLLTKTVHFFFFLLATGPRPEKKDQLTTVLGLAMPNFIFSSLMPLFTFTQFSAYFPISYDYIFVLLLLSVALNSPSLSNNLKCKRKT